MGDGENAYLFFPIPYICFEFIHFHLISNFLYNLLYSVQTLDLYTMFISHSQHLLSPIVFTVAADLVAVCGSELDVQGEDKAEILNTAVLFEKALLEQDVNGAEQSSPL